MGHLGMSLVLWHLPLWKWCVKDYGKMSSTSKVLLRNYEFDAFPIQFQIMLLRFVFLRCYYGFIIANYIFKMVFFIFKNKKKGKKTKS